jgi:hypothetical protein
VLRQHGTSCNFPGPGHIEIVISGDTGISDFRWPGLQARVAECLKEDPNAVKLFVMTIDRCL